MSTDSTTAQDLPTRLRAWRAAVGLSQAEAAGALAVPKGTWVQWEAGRRTPDAWKQQKLAEAMDKVLASRAAVTQEKGEL